MDGPSYHAKGGAPLQGMPSGPQDLGARSRQSIIRPDGWRFTSSLSGPSGSLGTDHPLDAFVDIKGRPLVRTSRKGLRPFNSREIDRILYVGLCLPCHTNFDDPVMKTWTPGNAPLPCSRIIIMPAPRTAWQAVSRPRKHLSAGKR